FLVIRTIADLVNMHAVPAGRDRAFVEHDTQHNSMRTLLHIDRPDFLTLVAEYLGGPFLGARGASQKGKREQNNGEFLEHAFLPYGLHCQRDIEPDAGNESTPG